VLSTEPQGLKTDGRLRRAERARKQERKRARESKREQEREQERESKRARESKRDHPSSSHRYHMAITGKRMGEDLNIIERMIAHSKKDVVGSPINVTFTEMVQYSAIQCVPIVRGSGPVWSVLFCSVLFCSFFLW
jgi:uncharacterized membrane protein YdbT with pleckstrin-like domain